MESRAEFENRIATLSHEEGAAWDKRGSLIAHKRGDAWLGWTDEEIEEMADGTMTHNHPSGLPPALSDYRLAVRAGLSEMRVVVREGIWVVRPPPGGWPGKTCLERQKWWESIAPDLQSALLERTLSARAHQMVVLFRQVTSAEVVLL